MPRIHPTAVISKEAEIDSYAVIGPFCLITGKVKIGSGSILEGHVTIGSTHGIVEIGKGNHFYPGAVIGGPPQDIGYKGDQTSLIIGDHNIFRECTTVNIATTKGNHKTIMGHNGYFMAYTHVGHDCVIGDNVIIANDSHLGGHCEIGDGVTIGGVCAFNQFTKVGKLAFIAGYSVVNKDILPFSRAQGTYAVIRATNKIGMARKGFSREEVINMHKAIRILTKGSDTVEEGLARIAVECTPSPNIDYFVDFVRSSKRGIAFDRGDNSMIPKEEE